MKLRARSTIFTPLLYILSLPLSVTSATWVVSTFSDRQYFTNFSQSLLSTTTAILSCDSLMASSVELRPAYLVGILSR